MPELLGFIREYPTTDEYTSALKLHLPPYVRRVLVHIKENDTADIRWKVLGSLDDVVYETIRDEEVVAQDGSDYGTLTDLWLWLDIQVISDMIEDHVHGLVTIYVSGA